MIIIRYNIFDSGFYFVCNMLGCIVWVLDREGTMFRKKIIFSRNTLFFGFRDKKSGDNDDGSMPVQGTMNL